MSLMFFQQFEFSLRTSKAIPKINDASEILEYYTIAWTKQITLYKTILQTLSNLQNINFRWVASPMLSMKAAAAWENDVYIQDKSQSIYNAHYEEILEDILGIDIDTIIFPDKKLINSFGFIDSQYQLPDRIDEDIHAAPSLYKQAANKLLRLILNSD